MPIFKFDDFVFDSAIYELRYKGARVSIRPKALKLLNLLIQNRHRMLSKAEIMSSIWGLDSPRDHLLFQLIGELRKPPFKSRFVRTQPNEGYQWNVNTNTSTQSFNASRKIMAGIACSAIALALFTLPLIDKVPNQLRQTAQLPAYSALSRGIIALEIGEKDAAIKWFEFAIMENPDSVESTILLAVTLFRQDRYEESQKYLQIILSKNNTSAYNKATATNLLSRISERQGKYDEALNHALKSSQENVEGLCSVEFVNKNINRLERILAMSTVPSYRIAEDSKESIYMPEDYLKQCNELKQKPTETSSCLALDNELIAYSFSVKDRQIASS